MDAGAYRNKIVFQMNKSEFDEIGNHTGVWSDFKTDYAYINNLSGKEYWEASVSHQEKTVEFVFRWKRFYDQMNTKEYRLIFNGQIYNITFIDNIQYRNKTVKIKAVLEDG